MKKLGKTLLAAAVMSLSVGVFAGINVSAATYSGEFTELYGDTYSWSVDTDIKTLTIDGNGGSGYFMDNMESPWLPYVKNIETVIIDSSIPANHGLRIHTTDELKNLKQVVQIEGDFKATYDLAAKTTTLSGQGKWPQRFVLIPEYDKLIIEDGITEFGEYVPVSCRDIVLGKDVKLTDPSQIEGYEELTVSNQNPYYSSYGNCLYTKGYNKLLVSSYRSTSVKLHPDVKVIGEGSLSNYLTETLVLPWGVTTVEKGVFNNFQNRITVVIPDTVTDFDPAYNNSDKVIFMISEGNDQLFNTLVKTGTEIWTTNNIAQYYPGIDTGKPVEPGQDEFAWYDGCKYTKDYRKLLYVPEDKKEVNLHPDVKIIGTGSFDTMDPPETIVIPWGVTTIEDYAFNFPFASPIPNVILPDTVTTMEQDTSGAKDSKVTFTYSRSNLAVHNVVGNVIDSIYGFALGNPVDSVDQYYPDRPVDPAQSGKKGWALENGKWYYYKDGHRTSGWILDQGTWYYLDVTGVMKTGWFNYNGSTYYLRPWGGMMMNGWYQIDGKWYYFQSWGGTAKSQWIYGLDEKWYYVGSDGVMLTNTQTPDGYWVDKNGVWVR